MPELKQESWVCLGLVTVSDTDYNTLAVLEINLDDGVRRRLQSKTGRSIAELVLDLIKRGVTCLAMEYVYYTPDDRLSVTDQIDILNSQLQVAKQRAMIKARVGNTLAKRPWSSNTFALGYKQRALRGQRGGLIGCRDERTDG